MDEKIKADFEAKKEEEKSKKRVVVLILGIMTILVAVIGASFAYFTSAVNNVKGNQSIVVSTTTLEGVTYQASDTLALIDAFPGDSAETTFTITNPNSSATVRYTLKFVADLNDFSNEEGDGQLLIKISGGEIDGEVVLDFTDSENVKSGIIVSNVQLPSSESDVYKMKLEFAETHQLQNTNQAKNFAGHIEITQSIVVDQ